MNPQNKPTPEEAERQQQELLAQQQALFRRKKEEERLAYEEQLRREKLALLRQKQGIFTDEDAISEENPEENHYTFGQKISNFFYHNKWWMGIAAFFVCLTGFLVWQVLSTVHPDMIILLVSDNDELNYLCNTQISALFSPYIGDANGDGDTVVDVYYMPVSAEKAENSGYTGDYEKLAAEFQIAEAVLVISDKEADAFIVPENTLYNLEEDFGQYQETEDMRFFLADTGFSEAIGWTQPLKEGMYIGIRDVRETMDTEEKMQEVFDTCYPALSRFIEEYGTPVPSQN